MESRHEQPLARFNTQSKKKDMEFDCDTSNNIEESENNKEIYE
jgi:hypothetical protein